jgi:hypothetical protein
VTTKAMGEACWSKCALLSACGPHRTGSATAGQLPRR